jgi:Lipocalin-like domain
MRSARIKTIACGVLVAMALTLSASTQTEREGSAREKLIGAWHLVRIDASDANGQPASGPQPKGMLVYTQDGHMSVQLMYPASADTLSNEYVLKGYEASFGSYDINETAHTVTHHVQGSITRDLLVGKDLPRKFEFTPDGHLIIRSTRPDEHWSVTWAHY